jgi:hypothetical protein
MAAMRQFLDDYAQGRRDGRYLPAELPELPFAGASFDLALSSHFLFLYSTQLGSEFHRAAVREMCRVAAEVRIFPLLALGGQRSLTWTRSSRPPTADFEVTIERVRLNSSAAATR